MERRRQSRVEWSFAPTQDESAKGYIAVESGGLICLHGIDEQGHATITTKNGQKGKVPSVCLAHRGGWEVQYDDDEISASSSSSGGFNCGIDPACSAAMRACSSGLLSVLILQLCWDFRSRVRDRNKEFRMNGLVLGRVCMGRMTSIIKVFKTAYSSCF